MRIGKSHFLAYDEIYHPGETSVYMRRWRLLDISWLGGIRIHHIVRGDSDRHYHDHPFSFFSLILRGGYEELRDDWCGTHVYESPDWNSVGKFVFHRITKTQDNTWTIVLHTRKSKPWGFLVDGKFVEADEYFRNYEDYQL